MNPTQDAGTGCLHLLNKAPGHPRFSACLAALAPGDRLVLIEDAVIAAGSPETSWPAGTCVSLPDLQARGLEPGHPGRGLTGIRYEELASLTAHHEKIVSW